MQTHVKVLGVFFIALSVMGICAAIFFLVGIGAAAHIVGANADPHDAAVALPIIGIAGTAFVVFILLISIPGLIVGAGLLKFKPWARIVGIVLCALNLISIPFGTILGIYGLWVLLHRDTEALFATSIQPLHGTP
jgi:hypothetical protein